MTLILFRAVKYGMIMYDKENEKKIAQQKQLFVISFLRKGYTGMDIKCSKGMFLDVMVDFNHFSLF